VQMPPQQVSPLRHSVPSGSGMQVPATYKLPADRAARRQLVAPTCAVGLADRVAWPPNTEVAVWPDAVDALAIAIAFRNMAKVVAAGDSGAAPHRSPPAVRTAARLLSARTRRAVGDAYRMAQRIPWRAYCLRVKIGVPGFCGVSTHCPICHAPIE